MEKITITFNETLKKEFTKPVKIKELLDYYFEKTKENVMGISIDNVIKNPLDELKKDTKVTCVTEKDAYGNKMYQAGLKFVMLVAAYELFGKNTKVEFLNSLDKGIYTKINKGTPFTKDDCIKLSNRMKELIKENLDFKKIIVDKKQAAKYYSELYELEKCRNIKNIAASTVTLYKLKDSYNYFYTNLPANTKFLTQFKLVYNDEDVILTFPTLSSNGKILEYHHYQNTLDSFNNFRSWLNLENALYVSDLNYYVQRGKINDLILTQELKAIKDMYKVVKEIIDKKIKFVLLAGPSSSGKTTTAKRLSLGLKACGIKSKLISTDDYFRDREETPKDKDGNYEFEVIEAIDLKLFQSDMEKLFNKKTIYPPKYNFAAGKKEFSKTSIKLDDDEIIIIEGLHCLNDRLLPNIDKKSKYKIYVSPFMGVRIDRHNHISSLDLRLLRRIVRDNYTRGCNATETLKSWHKVRHDESIYIYNFQNEADAIINTALVYELGVLKVLAEPLLQSVSIKSPYYEEAGRLINFLRSFCPITSENIPSFSVLREFIGGSIFKD